MFVVGLEVDVPKLKKTSGKAGLIALASVALPFCLGAFALAPHLHAKHNTVTVAGVDHPVPPLSFKLFVGTCMAVTAFPVLARIISEQGLQKLRLGSMTLACAALNDVVAWALLAIVLAVQQSQSGGSGEVEFKPVLIALALICVVCAAQFILVAPLMRLTVLRAYLRTGSLSPNRLAWVLICMLLSAWLMHLIGFHAMLGSFLFGLVFPRGVGTPFLYTILSKVEPFATLVLLPLFFMVTGLSIDLSQLSNSGMDLLYILLVASGGKFIGSGVPAKLLGLSWRHSIAIGVMMNTRGLTEIVVLNIAQQANILDDSMFSSARPAAAWLRCA
jgi:Kef-type K+ transport system membrane component KefB